MKTNINYKKENLKPLKIGENLTEMSKNWPEIWKIVKYCSKLDNSFIKLGKKCSNLRKNYKMYKNEWKLT